MKIAIYGDSYGIINTKWDTNEYSKMSSGESWTELLAHSHSVDNYAVSGSAFMLSYERFLRNHHLYDYNIFIVTNPQRIYIKELDGIPMFGVTWVDSEYSRVKKLPHYEKKQVHLEILQSARAYIGIWADWEMITHTQHVLVNNLWTLNERTLVIPGFSDSIMQTTVNLNDAARYELSLVDKARYDSFNFNNMDCKRRGHFSEQNNLMLYHTILDALSTNKKFIEVSLDKFIKPTITDFDFFVGLH